MKYEWKIEGVKAQDGLITQAKYVCRLIDKGASVDTEGTWFFRDPKLTVPYAEVTEEMVIDWIKGQTSENGKSIIETRLAEQMANLAAQTESSLPWSPQVFTPKI